MSRWFRFYSDAVRNPKVARLNDQQFRLWVELLTVAAENDGLIPPLEDLKHVLKRRLDHLSRGLEGLIRAELMDALEVGYEPHNWGERQYKSDTSTERVRKFREKRNVSVTPPETETETDTETDTDIKEPNGSLSEKSKAKRATALPKNWKPELTEAMQAMVSQWPVGELARQVESFRDHAAANGRTARDWQAAFRTWARKADEWRKQNGQSNRNPQQRGNHQPAQHNGYLLAALERKSGASDQRHDESGGWPEDG